MHGDGGIQKLGRGHSIALENKTALEGYLETMIQSATMKQKAYGSLVSSAMHAEPIDQLVSLPWRAEVLRHFEAVIRITPKIQAPIAIGSPGFMTGLTQGDYDSEERERSNGEKVFLMTSERDPMTQEGAEVACVKRRDALCFI